MIAQNIAFRVDASNQIGTGHFMRCLTLADALKQRSARIRFISRHLPEHLRSMLVAKGHEFVLLDSAKNDVAMDELAHAPWLGLSQPQDAADTVKALSDESWDWLIVDHYALDFRWETAMRGAAKSIMVIDDIADRQHDCDMLLDQNFYADMHTRYSDKVPEHCRLLLGPRYALLREEFRDWRVHAKPRTGPVKKILVFLGGVDAENHTGLTIEALADLDISDVEIDVVIGAQHPNRSEIAGACAKRGYVCHVQTDEMARLMAIADLSVGAGGSSTWERCAMGLPSMIMVLAENQRLATKDLENAGVLANLGEAEIITKAGLSDALSRVIKDEKLRMAMSLASLNLVPIFKNIEVAEILAESYV